MYSYFLYYTQRKTRNTEALTIEKYECNREGRDMKDTDGRENTNVTEKDEKYKGTDDIENTKLTEKDEEYHETDER